MDPLTTAPADVSIATIVDELARDFISLADALTTESRFATQVPSTAVYDEFSRFKLWAGNIAAHRKGRRSLEYRLRDAGYLKSETHSLLYALSTALRNALSIASGERVPWDELSNSDTDSDSDMSVDDASNDDLQGRTELSQLIASVKTLITSLFRLSMAIRNPAPNSQSTSTFSIDKSFYEQHDIQHVMGKFPNAPQYLSERLGRALSARRQYLSYREEHHNKLTKNIEKIGFEKATTEFTTNSTEATPIPRIERSMGLNVLDEEDNAASQTSFATSVNATIRVPSLPRKARNKDFFECPLCFLLVSIHTAAGWKQHVFRDLHPYCCTHEHCTIADRLYDSRKAWFAHELEAHRTAWQCIEECGKTFAMESDFQTHVWKTHPDLASASMFSALKRTSAKGAALNEKTLCALCGKSMALRALQRHLGSHQQQLALFALPPNLDDTEDDPDDDDNESAIVGNDEDEELSELSDTSDPELVEDAAELKFGDMNDDDTPEAIEDMQVRREEAKSSLHDIGLLQVQLDAGQKTPTNPTSEVSDVSSWMQGVTSSDEFSRDDTPSPINPPTPTSPGTYVVQQRRLSGSHPTRDGQRIKPEIIIQIGSSKGKDSKSLGTHRQQTKVKHQRAGLNPDASRSDSPDETNNADWDSDISDITDTKELDKTEHENAQRVRSELDRSDSRRRQQLEILETMADLRLRSERPNAESADPSSVEAAEVARIAAEEVEAAQIAAEEERRQADEQGGERRSNDELLAASPALDSAPSQPQNRGHQRASSSSSVGSSASQYQAVGPSAGYQYVAHSENLPSQYAVLAESLDTADIHSRSFQNHLPTPTHTPTQDSFMNGNNFNYPDTTMDNTMSAHMSMKQALMEQGEIALALEANLQDERAQRDLSRNPVKPTIERVVADTTIPRDIEMEPGTVRRRIPVACARCRTRKILCSGDPGNGSGCQNCQQDGIDPATCQPHQVRSAVVHQEWLVDTKMQGKRLVEVSGLSEQSEDDIADNHEEVPHHIQPLIPNAAVAMAIPRASYTAPPPIPPPSFVEQAWNGGDPRWQWGKLGQSDVATVNPSSRLNPSTAATPSVDAAPTTGSQEITVSQERQQLIMQLRLEEEQRTQEEKLEYDTFIRKQKEKEEKEKIAKEEAERELEESMRNRLVEFSFKGDEIDALVIPDKGKQKELLTDPVAAGFGPALATDTQLSFSDEEQRQQPYMTLGSDEQTEKAREERDLQIFLFERKKILEEQEREKAAEAKKYEETMRNRLAKFNLDDDQIEALVSPEEGKQKDLQPGVSTHAERNEIATTPQPTYAKVHKKYLDIETLHYYDIPYQYDADSDYIIILREMTQKETEILFEHTRRLRTDNGRGLLTEVEGALKQKTEISIEAEDRGSRGRGEYESFRMKPRTRSVAGTSSRWGER